MRPGGSDDRDARDDLFPQARRAWRHEERPGERLKEREVGNAWLRRAATPSPPEVVSSRHLQPCGGRPGRCFTSEIGDLRAKQVYSDGELQARNRGPGRLLNDGRLTRVAEREVPGAAR